MKKLDRYKTVQLILSLLLAGVSLYCILTDERLYHLVANDTQIRTLCILLWLSFVLSFLFIFIDFSLFSSLKRDYRELDFAVSSDPVSGIANRYSCDNLIEKYLDRPLPPGIGCIMFDLTNLGEINRNYGHLEGNELIRSFSGILQVSSRDLCFVGRNGGNSFLALFEECSSKKISTFLNRVQAKTERFNNNAEGHPILYRYGIAFEEGPEVGTITELIALSNKRVYEVSHTEEV